MSKPIIEVRNLSKKYRLGNIGASSLREEAEYFLQRFKYPKKTQIKKNADFWALQNVSFEVRPGEVLGVIGRNGAGKSTLLKILSRITEPTSGEAVLRGRVASLLEVGTGFHPELSGRDNIYLNGGILGMRRREITRQLDEIVAFAEIGQFLDTPVKRYSSGMYVRLAFAVAAHLEPEILIVDEVLAVGDAVFQKKCLGKMDEVARTSGRTVLFVSHNMGAVKQLTQNCLYLRNGTVCGMGPTREVLGQYTRDAESTVPDTKGRHATIMQCRLTDSAGYDIPAIARGEAVFLEVDIRTDGNPSSYVECYLTDYSGVKIALGSPAKFHNWHLPSKPGAYRVRMPLQFPSMASGNYLMDVCTSTDEYGFDQYVAGAITCTIPPGSYSDAWDLRSEYNAGYFILDAGAPSVSDLKTE